MIAIVWQFDVLPGRERAFEEFYGANGPWTTVNRQNRSYLGSSFLRDQATTSRYLLVEYWSEMLVYERHKKFRSDTLESLNETRNEIVLSVEALGVFTALDVPDRDGATWSQRG
jgi:hypothetical protein